MSLGSHFYYRYVNDIHLSPWVHLGSFLCPFVLLNMWYLHYHPVGYTFSGCCGTLPHCWVCIQVLSLCNFHICDPSIQCSHSMAMLLGYCCRVKLCRNFMSYCRHCNGCWMLWRRLELLEVMAQLTMGEVAIMVVLAMDLGLYMLL